MAALIRILGPFLLASAAPMSGAPTLLEAGKETPPSTNQAIERWQPFIAEASHRFGVPQAWIVAVMQAESGGQTRFHGRPTTSSAGAMGLMQVMPATWATMRIRYGLGSDPYDPRDNIMAGAAYLRWMYDRFGYPGLFAAYNAGPGRFAEHLRTGRALPSETRSYITQLAQTSATPSMPPAILSGARLFFALGRTVKPPSSRNRTTVQNPLFVPLGPSREGHP